MLQFVIHNPHQIGNGYPGLVHGIPIPERNLMVVQGIKINCDTKWGTDLVLPTITPPNALGVIVLSVKVLAQPAIDLPGGGDQLGVSAEGKGGYGNRGQSAMEVQHYPHRLTCALS